MRFHPHRLIACLLAVVAGSGIRPAGAAITLTGDTEPVYDGSDPWVIEARDSTGRKRLRVGPTAAGIAQIDGGSQVVADYVQLGETASGAGSLRVVGEGTSLTIDAYFDVGYEGQGALLLEDGAIINSEYGSIGNRAGSVGEAIVAGDAVWQVGRSLSVGRIGKGRLTVRDRGRVEPSTMEIGDSRDSEGIVLVTGLGSRIDVNGAIEVGAFGTGTLTVEQGARVVAGQERSPISIGGRLGGHGLLEVLGQESELNARGDIRVGATSSQGILRVGDGARATVGGSVEVSGTGSSVVVSGVLEVAGDTEVTGTPSAVAPIRLAGGELVTGGLIGSLDQLTGVGMIRTSGLVTDGDWRFDRVSALRQTLTSVGSDSGIELTVDVSDPSRVGAIGVGHTATGTLTIADGVSINSASGFLGFGAGSYGVATVSGTGTSWEISGDLEARRGRLSVAHGASVTTGGDLELGRFETSELLVGSGSTVAIGGTLVLADFTPNETVVRLNGGSLRAGSLLSQASDLVGHGTVTTHGLVSDHNLTVDASTGLRPEITLPNDEGVVNLMVDLSDPAKNGILGAGYRESSTLTIRGGQQVVSESGVLGYTSGAKGTARVVGEGTEWRVQERLDVGRGGHAELRVEGGATVAASSVVLSQPARFPGSDPSSVDRLLVSGPGSRLVIERWLSVSTGRVTDVMIEEGGVIHSDWASLGSGLSYSGTTAPNRIEINGSGSIWRVDQSLTATAGRYGLNELLVLDGGQVHAGTMWLVEGTSNGSLPPVDATTVGRNHLLISGPGSMISIDELILPQTHGGTTITIRDNGVLSTDLLITGDGNAIQIASGGSIETAGEADGSLAEFAGMLGSSNDDRVVASLNYWNGEAWSPLTLARIEVDYRLDVHYGTDGEARTRLTVLAVPEPACSLLALAATLARPRRER